MYISAYKNTPWLRGLALNPDDANTTIPEPRPALALVVAAVERALTYVAEGKITIASAKAGKTKGGRTIIADINPITSRPATAAIAFSEELWGGAVGDYQANIANLTKSDMEKIVTAARKFSRATRTHDDDDDDIVSARNPANPRSGRALIPLNYGNDKDSSDDDADNGTATQAMDIDHIDHSGAEDGSAGDDEEVELLEDEAADDAIDSEEEDPQDIDEEAEPQYDEDDEELQGVEDVEDGEAMQTAYPFDQVMVDDY